MDAYDPIAHTRILYAQNLDLRDLLAAVAQDLERLAAHRPAEAQPLLPRAQRIPLRPELAGE